MTESVLSSDVPTHGAHDTHATAAAAPGTFADLGLPRDLLDAVSRMGFTTPTDIQAAVIPTLLAGRDVTGVAQTGTGKTAAFGLPLLATIDPERRSVQALVLTPTRELAMQVSDAIGAMAAASRGVNVLAIYGGSPYGPQLRGIQNGAQVIVGTPGRVIDMLERGALDLAGLKFLALDEADEMLRMGFAEDVDQILTHAADDRQTALFSATMPPAIRKVARTHMNDPVEVATARQSSTTDTITQTYAVVPFRHKIGALARVLATTPAEAALVFVRTRGTAEDVGSALIERGINAATISGDVAQRERERIVERLRNGTLNVLVATDVAARGLDVDRIGLVVNFDVPGEPEAYVHRIGRTGRAGRTGIALTFLTPRERGRLRAIERVTRTPLTEVPIPTPAQVSAHRATTVLDSVTERIGNGRLESYREQLAGYLLEGEDTAAGDPLDVAAALLALAVGDTGPKPWREDEAVENPDGEFSARFDTERPERVARGAHDERRGPSRGHRPSGTGTVYRVAVGHTHGARPQDIVGAITGEGGLRGSDLGKIDIFSRFSLVEISADVTPEASRRIGNARVAGQALKIRPDEGGPRRGPRVGDAKGHVDKPHGARGQWDKPRSGKPYSGKPAGKYGGQRPSRSVPR
ncbi:DEAD/DEAH box helicase [Occultella glacieicola]|uniref:RNA helicase n=1 Tax=Occultella glacieicola TaxID=2518684 RepID=A0ABY2E3M8_9MICO|nr:DEAD/DEAH box helicase [Occultella glacieicola]TDE92468.1 DEAD/DEAH box helicase [Occultella glacieicola]